MFGYRADFLTGKDISIVMPELIGDIHRGLMVKFFDKPESRTLNRFRELFMKDADGYLVPIILYPKVLPNLQKGLKFIGAIKRISQLQMGHSVPEELAKFS